MTEEQFEFYVSIITRYFLDNPPDLDEYVWPPRNPVPVLETLAARNEWSQKYNRADQREKFIIANNFVREWGGIFRNRPETIRDYVNSAHDNVLRGAAGIATWSKILCLLDPEQYLIFDARVTFTLNVIIESSLVEGEVAQPIYFPKLTGRNTAIVAARNRQAQIGGTWPVAPFFEGATLYPNYCSILFKVAQRLRQRNMPEVTATHLEMMLFARAPILAEHIWRQEDPA